MTRGGQVYYVYNRVNNIAEVTAELQRLLPECESCICTWTDERTRTGRDHDGIYEP